MSLCRAARTVLVVGAFLSRAAPATAQPAPAPAEPAAAPSVSPPSPAPPAVPAPAPAPDTSHDNVPARVKVLELTVRAAPSADAPVLRVLPSGTLLNVSPGQRDGWRRTRLPDGQLGYVANAGLDFGPSPAASAAPGTAAPVEPIGARPHPQIYIKDLDHLASLVAQDPVVSPMVQGLISRREGAWAVGIGGSAVGLIVTTVGLVDTSKTCPVTSSPYYPAICTTNFNTTAIITGLSIMLVSDIIMAIAYPKRGDYLDVINAWNTRHLDNQITIETVSTTGGGIY